MKVLICLISFFALSTCITEKHIINRELKADSDISIFFNDKEIVELGKIILFFENQICLDKSISKEKCYYEFNKKTTLNYQKNSKNYKVPIDYHIQKRLYSKIGSNFFKQIWTKRQTTMFLSKDKEIKYSDYNINSLGKYFLFVKSLKDKDWFFKEFYDGFKTENAISFSLQSKPLSNFELKEFKDIKRRLFFAIYYLTVNDKMYNYPKNEPTKTLILN